MTLPANAGNGKRPTLSVKFPHAGGYRQIELSFPAASHLMLLHTADRHGARIPANSVDYLKGLGFDIATLSTSPCWGVPALYRLLTPIDAAWIE